MPISPRFSWRELIANYCWYYCAGVDNDHLVLIYEACQQKLTCLTHWGRDKINAILQTTFSNAISWMKKNFNEVCSLRSNWQYSSIGSDNGLAPTRRQAIIWANDDPVQRRIYASLGLNELTHRGRDKMDIIFQTTFSSEFSWMKMYEFRWRFHWNLFLGFELTIFHHWFR